jgi:hypothetical protein
MKELEYKKYYNNWNLMGLFKENLANRPILILVASYAPLLISANGFAFLGALLEPPRLRLRGLHLALSPSGVSAFCSNPQL